MTCCPRAEQGQAALIAITLEATRIGRRVDWDDTALALLPQRMIMSQYFRLRGHRGKNRLCRGAIYLSYHGFISLIILGVGQLLSMKLQMFVETLTKKLFCSARVHPPLMSNVLQL